MMFDLSKILDLSKIFAIPENFFNLKNSASTRDLRLLYHLWFPKSHTHISYSQYFYIA